MAFDEALADRIREVLAPRAEVAERKMFGGIAFMVGGHMAVGVIAEDLMVRLDPADAERALAEPHVRPMDFTGRPMKGMVYVEPAATADESDLAAWVDAGADHAACCLRSPSKRRAVRSARGRLGGAGRLCSPMGNKLAPSGSRDAAIAKVAGRQYGIVTTKQLEAIGLGRSSIAKRMRGGRLHRVHRGVYSVGHPPFSPEARWMAAVLACGEGAVLSHGSAAVLWGLLRPLDGPIHVSVPSHTGRGKRTGIRLHRCPSLAAPPSLLLFRTTASAPVPPSPPFATASR